MHNINTEEGMEKYILGLAPGQRVEKPPIHTIVYTPRASSKGPKGKKPNSPPVRPATRPIGYPQITLKIPNLPTNNSTVGGSYLKTKKRNQNNRKKHTHKKHMF